MRFFRKFEDVVVELTVSVFLLKFYLGDMIDGEIEATAEGSPYILVYFLGQDALTSIISQQTQRELGLQCPILSVSRAVR